MSPVDAPEDATPSPHASDRCLAGEPTEANQTAARRWADVCTEVLPPLTVTVGDPPRAVQGLERALIRALATKADPTDPHTAAKLFADSLAEAARRTPTRSDIAEPFDLDARVASTNAVADDALLAIVRGLPLRQRAAVVVEVADAWRDSDAAVALDTTEETAALRRQRAWREIERRAPEHVTARSATVAAIEQALRDAQHANQGFDLARLQRHGRHRRIGRQLLLAVGVIISIAAIGSMLRLDQPVAPRLPPTVASVEPPRGAQQPFAPIGDGTGGFVAIEPRGFEIISSDDGVDWFPAGDLNVHRVDLRLDVDRFDRSDGRFLAVVNSTTGGGRSPSGSDMPRVAIAEALDRWQLVAVNAAVVPDIAGLRPRLDLHEAAAVGSRILVTGRIGYEIDYHAYRLQLGDVCAVADDADGIVVHQCNGETLEIADSADRLEARLGDGGRLFASEAMGPFDELDLPARFNSFGLFSFGDWFAMIDEASSTISTSTDGRRWDTLVELDVDNRLGLTASHGDEALVVSPDDDRWATTLLAADGSVRRGELPLDIDPTTVWLKPVAAGGPAGWAVFVTTARPWERQSGERVGWAVHSGDWIVERKVDTDTIVLRSTTEQADYDYERVFDADGAPLEHPFAEWSPAGDLTLRHPGTGHILKRVTATEIDAAWTTGSGDTTRHGAVVVWSRDGVEWETIWQSATGGWFGSIAVGDDEVLLSASGVLGEPERLEVPTG